MPVSHAQQHPQTSSYSSASSSAPAEAAHQYTTHRLNAIARPIRTTDYFLEDQKRMSEALRDDLSAVQSFLNRCQSLSTRQAFQFVSVRASSALNTALE
ncbi:MAG: hypothetical protein VKJ06_03475 [Vampirovibrionales bacterium]|nr:hypothetical protein [Vampirovibrionales bacterium]